MVTGTVIAVIAIVGIGIVMTAQQRKSSFEPTAIPGLLWPPPEKQLGKFSLTDHFGNSFDGSKLKGKWSFLFFGYTHCPDVCPQTLAVMSQVTPQLPEVARENLQMLFVSVDQQRDTPQELAAYLSYFSADITGLTGETLELRKLTAPLGIAYTTEPLNDTSEYLVEHSSAVLVIDPQLRLVGIFSPPHRATDMAARFRKMRAFVEEQT